MEGNEMNQRDELTAAARSLRDDFLPLSPQAAKAIATVTDYVLATVAADETPIDEAWADSIDVDGVQLRRNPNAREKRLRWHLSIIGPLSHFQGFVTTRGEVLLACRALNIAIQPSEQETQS